MADIPGKAAQTEQELEEGVYTRIAPDDPKTVQGGAKAESFARDFKGARDPQDQLMMMKAQMVQQKDPYFGQVTASDSDFRWLAKKAKAAEEVDFDDWFGSNFHTNDLATRKFAQEINPGYYDARIENMAKRAKLALRIRAIQLRGPQSDEDLKLVYMFNRGLIELDANWDRIGPPHEGPVDPAKQQAAFRRQLFNLPDIFSNKSRVRKAQDRENPFRSKAGVTGAPIAFPDAPPTVMDSWPDWAKWVEGRQ